MIEKDSSPPLIRNIISSDIQELDQLHTQYKWIPSSVQIRPSPELLAVKRDKIDSIGMEWVSFKDYILHHVFQKPSARRHFDNMLYATDDQVINLKSFQPNLFPYDIQQGQHWVMWYGQEAQDSLLIADITQDIDNELRKQLCIDSDSDIGGSGSDIGGSGNYDFAWYVNPKMSIPEFFHVQVFWTTL